MGRTAKNLWVSIYGFQGPSQGFESTLQPNLQARLSLDALDSQLELTDVRVEPGANFNEVGELGLQRDLKVQILDLQVELIDLEHRHVQVQVRTEFRLRILAVLWLDDLLHTPVSRGLIV
jgi:hypothetical protein